MKDGRTFRMRIVEHTIVDIEVMVPASTSQDNAEKMVRCNYAQLQRDGALMRELARDLPSIELRRVIEVSNRG